MSQQSEGTIIAAVLAGDAEQFEVLVHQYQRPLMRFAVSKLGRYEWAEDAVQEAFVSAFRSLHTYDSRYSFRTWLWTITLNQCRRVYDKQMRRKETQADLSEEGSTAAELQDDPSSSPTAIAFSNERRQLVDALLNELKPKLANAVRLRFFGGLKFQEIADCVKCSLTTAKVRVRDGLALLSERLKSHPAREALISDSRTESDEEE